MEINIRTSNKMDTKKISDFGISEHRLLHMPQDLRVLCGIEKGTYISLYCIDGNMISLQVVPAYEEDITKDTLSAYVTSKTGKLLGLSHNKEIGKEVSLVNGITLGCDPEFFLVDADKGFTHRASAFFNKWGDVGYDGVMAEIRPLPSTSEQVVTDNIYLLICKARTLIDTNLKYTNHNIIMVAASTFNNVQAGFHLHYGIPQPILGPAPPTSIKERLLNLMVKSMDFYLGIPSIIPEGSMDYIRRTHPFIEYGKPGGYRLDTRTLEYRVPGGSLLRHPALTRGLLALGAVVVEDIVSRINHCTDSFINLKEISSINDLQELYPHIPPTTEIFKAICNQNINIAKAWMQTIQEDVRNMVGYKRRSKTVDDFFTIIMSDHIFSNNIEENWRKFYYEAQQRQMGVYRS